jgi:tRNA-2-methylthio-N6-dimethylallyladenosine synthase
LIDEIAWTENKKLSGATLEVLVAEGEGRKDGATHRMSGRARDNRLVHFAPTAARPGDVVPEARPGDVVPEARPGDVVPEARPGDAATVVVTYAAPHHLVADTVLGVRRTRGGDAWQARHEDAPARGVSLGMPTLRPAADAAR